MTDIARNRTILTVAAAIAIILGLLLLGGSPSAATPAPPRVDQASTDGRADVNEGDAGQYVIRDYAEFRDNPVADLPSSDWLGLLMGMLVKLALVIAVFYAAVWGLRRYLLQGRSPALVRKPVSVLGAQNLSPSRTVYILEIGRKVLVVGATQTQMSLLAEVTDPDAVDELRALNAGHPSVDQFSSLLNSAVRQLGVKGSTSADVSDSASLHTQILKGCDFMRSRLAQFRQFAGER